MAKGDPFDCIASLNLFREADGTHEITISSTDPTVMLEAEDKPIDHIENLILAAALRMRERKIADGTFRQMKGTPA